MLRPGHTPTERNKPQPLTDPCSKLLPVHGADGRHAGWPDEDEDEDEDDRGEGGQAVRGAESAVDVVQGGPLVQLVGTAQRQLPVKEGGGRGGEGEGKGKGSADRLADWFTSSMTG